MEKLIELLNQFEKEKKSWYTWRSIDSYDNCVYGVDCDWETEITMYSDLYSKYYWFIQWLVDNDKIDESKIDIHWFSFYESVLMELAIKENTIEFLISITNTRTSKENRRNKIRCGMAMKEG